MLNLKKLRLLSNVCRKMVQNQMEEILELLKYKNKPEKIMMLLKNKFKTMRLKKIKFEQK